MFFDKLVIEKEIPFRINRKAVYALLGYRKGTTTLSEKMASLVDASFKEALELVDPLGIYITRKIKEKGSDIYLARSPIILKGKSVQMLLKDSFAVTLLAAAIGPGVENKISEETERGNLEKALILDVIGSEAVEAVANSFNARLISLARQDKNFLTTRFSPGYGDLDLGLQRDLYKELALEETGITITEKNMLFPQKTITAVIGVEK